jgi:S1-C subfamily serine protease/HEAT repeat protein
MFEYTCPLCQTTATVPNVPKGNVSACTRCGQGLRILVEEEDPRATQVLAGAQQVARGTAGLGAMALLIGGCGLAGMTLAAVIVLAGYFISGKPGKAASKEVAQATPANIDATPLVASSKDPGNKPVLPGPVDDPGKSKAAGSKPVNPDNWIIAPDNKADNPSKLVTPPQVVELSGAQIYRKLLKSTVYIVSFTTTPEGRYRGWGTGALIDRAERLVVTNEHVANERADSISILFPVVRSGGDLIKDPAYYDGQIQQGKGIPARIVKVDRKHDLALLQLDHLPDDAVPLRLASGSVSSLQTIYSVGAQPKGSNGMWQGHPGTVRQVFFQAWRYNDGFQRGAEMIQSDMAINPGDSGGPVVDNRCVLVGVNALSDPNLRLVTGHIDVSEIKALLRASGKKWSEAEEADGPATAAVQQWLKDLESGDAEERRRAIMKLAELGREGREAVPALLKLLRNARETDSLRQRAEKALAEIGAPLKSKDSMPVLLDALQDKTCKPARVYAAAALGNMGDFAKTAIPNLVSALKDPEMEVRRNAAATLGKIGASAQNETYAALLALLQDKEEDVRRTTKGTLFQLGDPTANDLPTLKKILAERQGSSEGRSYAAAAIAALGSQAIPPLLDALTKDPDPEVVHMACAALGFVGGKNKDVAQALANTLDHKEKTCRVLAADSLGRLGVNDVTLPSILKALGSPEVECRKAVYGHLPDFSVFSRNPPRFEVTETSVDPLKASLASEQPIARWFAAYALGMLNRRAAGAVSELGRAIEKERKEKLREGQTHNPVQLEMVMALAEIGPSANAHTGLLSELVKDPTLPKHNQTAAGLVLVSLTFRDDDKLAAYRVLTKTLLVEPKPGATAVEMTVDIELQERAKKALQKGGKFASKAMYENCIATFNGTAPDKTAARLSCYELWEKMGREAADLRSTDAGDKQFNKNLAAYLTFASTKGELVLKNRNAATAAGLAIFGK